MRLGNARYGYGSRVFIDMAWQKVIHMCDSAYKANRCLPPARSRGHSDLAMITRIPSSQNLLALRDGLRGIGSFNELTAKEHRDHFLYRLQIVQSFRRQPYERMFHTKDLLIGS